MREFCPMAAIHADLVGPLPEGRNSRGQRGFQYILSVVDSATRYLWLLPIRHKTAECVAAMLFDEVISRISVPSAILTDRGGEFLGEVVECLLKRLGISHLRTSAYHPETDAKCERIHFSIHNMITKMIDEKHERWPDLLGTVALAYNATVHTTTGYLPHELFYSFAPSCPSEAVVSTPASDPASNADEFALQSFERLQEATAFVREYTGKNIQCMKRQYDSAVKPQSYEIGEKVLVYNPKNQHGKFAKWQIRWVGPYVVENKLNQANYVVKKGRGKLVVIHIDRLHKLLTELNSDNAECPVSDSSPTSQPNKRRRADNAAMATSTQCTETASCTDSELSRSITRSAVNHTLSTHVWIGPARTSVSTFHRYPKVQIRWPQSQRLSRQATSTIGWQASGARRRPAQYLQQVQARLTNQACARSTIAQTAATLLRPFASQIPKPTHVRRVVVSRKNRCLLSPSSYRSDLNMPRSRIFHRDADCSYLESDSHFNVVRG